MRRWVASQSRQAGPLRSSCSALVNFLALPQPHEKLHHGGLHVLVGAPAVPRYSCTPIRCPTIPHVTRRRSPRRSSGSINPVPRGLRLCLQVL